MHRSRGFLWSERRGARGDRWRLIAENTLSIRMRRRYWRRGKRRHVCARPPWRCHVVLPRLAGITLVAPSARITYAGVIRLPRSEQSRDHPGIDTRTSGQQAFE